MLDSLHFQLLSPGDNQLQYNIWYHRQMLTGDFFYDVSLTVPCLKSIKLNRNYVLKCNSTLPEYLWLGSSGYILAGREGGCGRHGEQTDAFVCFDYHQYLLADQPVHISWCIWPGKKDNQSYWHGDILQNMMVTAYYQWKFKLTKVGLTLPLTPVHQQQR